MACRACRAWRTTCCCAPIWRATKASSSPRASPRSASPIRRGLEVDFVRPFLTLHHPAAAQRYYAQGLWQGDTFYALLARQATGRPHAPALRDGKRTLTWQQLLDWVDGVAADLRVYGLTGGDRVSMWLSNRAEAVVLLLACAREGFACNPSLHRTYTCEEIAQLLRRLSARALLTEPGWGADRASVNFDAVLAGVPSLKTVYSPESFP